VLLLAAAIVMVAVVGGLVYSGYRQTPPDASAPNAGGEPTPLPVTKATAPARKLNEKERLLVGLWKFGKSMPPMPGQGYEATVEYRADGTFIFRERSATIKPYAIRGTYQIVGDLSIARSEDGGVSTVLIEELTADRIVKSYPDGDHRHVEEWSRVREMNDRVSFCVERESPEGRP
jgi:hypothetical protein